MREAQRRGHEDALAGRESAALTEHLDDEAWRANYVAARNGLPSPPPPWPEVLSFALLTAARIELLDLLGLPPALTMWIGFTPVSYTEPLRRRQALALGIGRNDELPLLRARADRASCSAIPVVALAGVAARRIGVRTSLISLATSISIAALRRYDWRRAGLPTRPPGRGRPSAPGSARSPSR